VSLAGPTWQPETIEEVGDSTFRVTGSVSATGQTSGVAGVARFDHRLTLRDGRLAQMIASIPSNLE
jgi:hypothetical protein